MQKISNPVAVVPKFCSFLQQRQKMPLNKREISFTTQYLHTFKSLQNFHSFTIFTVLEHKSHPKYHYMNFSCLKQTVHQRKSELPSSVEPRELSAKLKQDTKYVIIALHTGKKACQEKCSWLNACKVRLGLLQKRL